MAQTIAKVARAAGARAKGPLRHHRPRLRLARLPLAKDGEAWRFFEIDPVVIGIASEAALLHLPEANCQPKPDIVLGDARLTMAKEAPTRASI